MGGSCITQERCSLGTCGQMGSQRRFEPLQRGDVLSLPHIHTQSAARTVRDSAMYAGEVLVRFVLGLGWGRGSNPGGSEWLDHTKLQRCNHSDRNQSACSMTSCEDRQTAFQ